MKQPDDQVYIDKVKQGDSASFAFLVDRYKHMAYTIALRIMRNAEDAEDAAQEGFVKAYQQLHRFEGKSKFSTWLYTIVYRVAITKLEQQRVATVPIQEELTETYSNSYQTNQLESLQVSDQQKYIKDAIERLPATEGLLITLYYLDEKSIREIEEITGLSESNIKVKLFRARKVLEEQLRFLL
ncbi:MULTISPECIES: sigma-70 family RNA polymerase sigma factor [unclassified Spirosoma]|uniref:RNA polymerase sigma factor n=1 Tax=unclassified Spirosoma TaxID=2621999 RepID=UPI00095AC1CF|nr:MULTISPECIES: sigma-70 family RNA polymerase sigma factor [unclassified Spirosoma]MBN8824699.1 sigma-70 family RNA polymerase sigma factor [Spirosoma sp.]OJW79015.1 MAG: RNA polymerase subunit sigma-24 [Spirosoma sp. 48-14]